MIAGSRQLMEEQGAQLLWVGTMLMPDDPLTKLAITCSMLAQMLREARWGPRNADASIARTVRSRQWRPDRKASRSSDKAS